MKYIFLLILFFLFLNSCSYNVSINKDGSAHVEILTLESKEKIEGFDLEDIYSNFDNHTSSPLISNYKRETKKKRL